MDTGGIHVTSVDEHIFRHHAQEPDVPEAFTWPEWIYLGPSDVPFADCGRLLVLLVRILGTVRMHTAVFCSGCVWVGRIEHFEEQGRRDLHASKRELLKSTGGANATRATVLREQEEARAKARTRREERHGRPGWEAAFEREKSVSIRAFSAGLPTLGKRR